MATKLYLRYNYIGEDLENSSPPDVDINSRLAITPQGSWVNSSKSFTMSPTKFQDGGWIARQVSSQTAVDPTNRVFGYWCSPPLDSDQTITGTIDLIAGIIESNAAANNYWRLYVWVRKPDGTVRGVLLTTYAENTTNEFPLTATVAGLQSPQTLSSVSALKGDRIIAEIGYISRNSTNAVYNSKLYIGTSGFDDPHNLLPDAVVGDLPGTGSDDSFAGHILFSQNITFDEAFDFPVSEATEITSVPYSDSKSIADLDAGWPYRTWYTTAAKVETWYKYIPASDGYFSVNALSNPLYPLGNYRPITRVWVGTDASGGFLTQVAEALEFTQAFWTTAGKFYFIRLKQNETAVTPVTAGLDFIADVAPAASTLTNAIVVQDDTDTFPATVWGFSGTFLGVIPETIIPAGEQAAVLLSGISAWARTTDAHVRIVSAAQALIADIDLSYPGGQILQIFADRTNNDKFYILQWDGLQVNPAVLSTITDAGVLDFEILTLPADSAGCPGFGVSRDNTKLYYAPPDDGDLHVYDLIGLAPLTDIPNPNPGYKYCKAIADLSPIAGVNPGEILVMSNGDIVFKQYQEFPLTGEALVHLDSDGNVLHNYLYDQTIDGFINHIDISTNDAEASIWIWRFGPTGAEDSNITYSKFNLNTGTVEITFTVESFAEGTARLSQDTTLFGPSGSCDFIVIEGANGIIVNKVTVPSDDETLFDFETTGGLDPETFSLADGDSQSYENLDAGTYGVTEVANPAYFTTYDVSNGNPHDAIVLGEEDLVIVTVTNTLLPTATGGIYQLVPGKRNDTLYASLSPVETLVVKIP